MKLKPYPKYKELGVQWIGEIPEEWKFHKLKFMLSALQSGSRENDETVPIDKGAFSIGGEHINWDGTLKLDNERFVSFEYYSSMNRGKIQENDVLLVKDGATIGKTTLVIKKPFEKMAVNEHVFILRPNKKISPKLLYYLIDSDSGFRQIKLTETGSAQGGINTEFANRTLFSITEKAEEQEKITDFLDSKILQISKIIEADKRLIDLLKEKRIALINHVVTKGLNPKTEFKDSGIDWIGEIPEDWEVKRLNKSAYVKRGASPRPIDDQKYFDDNGIYGWVRIEDVTASDKYLLKTFEKLSTLGKSLSVPLNPGEIFISIAGSVGKPIITKIKCCIHDGFVYFQRLKLHPDYLYYIFIGGEVYKGLGKLGTQLNLNTETIGSIKIPTPSKQEQIQISEYLDTATSKIDQTIKKIEEKITLLEEFKKSLIHHVVTGKVDVRCEI